MSESSLETSGSRQVGGLLAGLQPEKDENMGGDRVFGRGQAFLFENEENPPDFGPEIREICRDEESRGLDRDASEESADTDTADDWEEVRILEQGQPGHIARDCFQEMCTNCGTINDHLASRCPMLQKCHNCNELGHILIDCKKPRKINICSTCSSKYHPDDMCPRIWRCYTFNPDAPKEFIPKRYCYNCAEFGHYGDNCRLPQFSRYLESSAFCIDNEPIPASEYEYMKHRETMKKKKLLKTYREYEKEDWFARKMKKKCVDHKSPRLDTFQRDKPYNRTNYVNSVYNRRDGLLYNDSDKQKNKKYDRKRLKRSLNRGKSIYIDLIPR
ncbi:hypothetical protein MERGE_001446 [Pneumocystis wakefieldiae]|uniref:CCHC-type domain-containing protein n=1 Tax=Pneumocystis wakefieldiae TaxID=38082 RepID=A0A899G6M0_9ASCO|nr:hypothetical protein MERGE_001446 [Pneumocystis wakefieldiae]